MESNSDPGRERRRVNYAFGDVLRKSIDDVVAATPSMTPEQIVQLLRLRLDECERALVANRDVE